MIGRTPISGRFDGTRNKSHRVLQFCANTDSNHCQILCSTSVEDKQWTLPNYLFMAFCSCFFDGDLPSEMKRWWQEFLRTNDMTAFTIIISLLCFGYGVWSAITGTIWVGSKSYHGMTNRYTRQDNPLLFWFWCAIFVLVGLFCAIALS